MNPTIGAALISGGWAAIVAGLGYWFNRVTAKATIRATNANAVTTLDASYDAQLWAKKSEAYVDLIEAVTRRQEARNDVLDSIEPTGDRPKQAPQPLPEHFGTESITSRLVVFTPDEIVTAVVAANKAHKKVAADLELWQAATITPEVFEALTAAAHSASLADKQLTDLIHADLALKPSQRISPNEQVIITKVAAEPTLQTTTLDQAEVTLKRQRINPPAE